MNIARVNHYLILVVFFAMNIIYCQKSQMLIETQLKKYGPDLKTNYYILNVTPSSGTSSFGKSYDINNGDNVLFFYDLVQFDITNYPLNCTISSYNKVQPTQTGGPECSQGDQATIVSPKSFSMSGCHGLTRFLLLDLPTNGESGNCEIISIKKQVILSNEGYSWQYKKENDTEWNYFEYDKQYNANGLSFSPSDVSDLVNYTGNLFIRFVVDYENLELDKIENYVSNISIYNIKTCSPLLDNTSSPNYTTCNYSNGEVIFTFSRPIETDEKYLFNRNIVGSTFVTSTTSNDNDVEKISPTTFKWKNIPPGDYQFKYQTQFEDNKPGSVSLISSFTILPREQLNFKATAVQPLCSSDKGAIIISASGGTSPYYYILDNESKKLLINNPDTIPLSTDGVHKVIVMDSKECIEK
ncbi:hypothetical protein B0A64_10595 [Flavobacterium araucananum]|uniref:Uncharacterized protein n=2 Tax=Flavobacterium araucananum TaxID=946678 RepID=A0A227P9G2_9FLAO|nr:hypothetical protein B0A64_10595 [Flavobacterium araucananum]